MVEGAGFGVSSARSIIAISSNFGDKKRCGDGRKKVKRSGRIYSSPRRASRAAHTVIISENGHFLIRRRPEKRIMRTHPLWFSKVAQFVTSFLRSLYAKHRKGPSRFWRKGAEVVWWKKEGREVS
jgi:hypothetical protein